MTKTNRQLRRHKTHFLLPFLYPANKRIPDSKIGKVCTAPKRAVRRKRIT